MKGFGVKVCAVIVTYGNRFCLLRRVIESLLKQGIGRIVVVDNNSVEESRDGLKKLEVLLKEQLRAIYLSENCGSAEGFKIGLEDAYRHVGCQFIWMLDDDNKPRNGALQELLEFWCGLEKQAKEQSTCLLSYRRDRTVYRDAIAAHNPRLVLGRDNSFLGFNILDLPAIIRSRLRRGTSARPVDQSKRFGNVAIAPFGGMFFHKRLLEKIGYPDERFFLYGDDHEFSYRITKMGGEIVLLLDSVIEDIDKSWRFRVGRESVLRHLLLNCDDDVAVYYSVRNLAYFERNNLLSNELLYVLNRALHMLVIKVLSLIRGKKERMRLIRLAVEDGLAGKLGRKKGL